MIKAFLVAIWIGSLAFGSCILSFLIIWGAVFGISVDFTPWVGYLFLIAIFGFIARFFLNKEGSDD